MRLIKLPRVYPIINVDSTTDPLARVETYLRAGAKVLQLRNKSLDERVFTALTRDVLALRNKLLSHLPYCEILINDSVGICSSTGADGVHLGQDDEDPQAARKVLGQNAIIGLSTHSVEEALIAPRHVLNYLALGPIFPSPTKSGHAAEVGLSGIESWKQAIDFPLVCIGGITKENAPKVFHSGADSVALISALERDPSLIRELAPCSSGNSVRSSI